MDSRSFLAQKTVRGATARNVWRRPNSCSAISAEEETLAVAFRKNTLLPLDDCLYALQATIPHLTRSSLIAASIIPAPAIGGETGLKKAFKRYRSATSTSISLKCAPKKANSLVCRD